MSVSVAIPSPSLRRDPSSEPLLDSGYRRGNEETGVSSKAAPLKKKYAINTMKCFGVELSPDNIAVAMVYFVQGVLGLSRIAVNFYLKDDLHLDPAEPSYLVCHHYLGLSNPCMDSLVIPSRSWLSKEVIFGLVRTSRSSIMEFDGYLCRQQIWCCLWHTSGIAFCSLFRCSC